MLIELTPLRTYATRENAVKAVHARLAPEVIADLTWFVMPDSEGRFFPVFCGERAVQRFIFRHFNIVG
jgi:hypothetical protein